MDRRTWMIVAAVIAILVVGYFIFWPTQEPLDMTPPPEVTEEPAGDELLAPEPGEADPAPVQ
jgi:hypothetical protein